MKLIFFITLATLTSQITWAKTQWLSAESFAMAEKSSDYIRFDMKSTKLGLVTTSFSGFVKKAKIDYTETPQSFEDIVITFQARDLDTNVSARNEKMWSLCFESEKHPAIVLKIPRVTKGAASQVPAEILLRGRMFPLEISFSKTSQHEVQGAVHLSLKGLEIPDPSILVAKVEDPITIQFHLSQPQDQK